ncbi:MAG: hypothetical protein LBK98_08065, partial [Peptococcaceae bacterium]|nr:hypothetical protein [Peptococcaceae bacterium]
IFDLTLGHALERFYDEWGERRAAILTACIPLCREMALRDKLTAYLLSVQERKNARQAYYAGLSVAAAQKIMLILIRTYDGDGAAEDYIGQNLVNSDFRKMAIEKALAAGRLEQVLTLCLEGEALNAKDKGQVSVWRHIRYDVYEKQNNILALKELAFEFTLNGEFPYYLRLKELYADGEGGDGGDGGEALSPVSTGEWPAVLAGLLQALESEWQSPVYIKILIHEKNQPKLLACCRKNVPSIVQLYPHLIPERAGEVDELFVEYIRYKAERASGRGDYQDVGGIICHYGKACGWNAADRIIRELLSLYRGRPAFVDELKKAKNTR